MNIGWVLDSVQSSIEFNFRLDYLRQKSPRSWVTCKIFSISQPIMHTLRDKEIHMHTHMQDVWAHTKDEAWAQTYKQPHQDTGCAYTQKIKCKHKHMHPQSELHECTHVGCMRVHLRCRMCTHIQAHMLRHRISIHWHKHNPTHTHRSMCTHKKMCKCTHRDVHLRTHMNAFSGTYQPTHTHTGRDFA